MTKALLALVSLFVSGDLPSTYVEKKGLSIEVVELIKVDATKCKAAVRFRRADNCQWEIGGLETMNIGYLSPTKMAEWKSVLIQLGRDFSLGKTNERVVEFEIVIVPASTGFQLFFGASSLGTREITWKEATLKKSPAP